MTMMMQRIGDGEVTMKVNVVGFDGDGRDVESEHGIQFFYDVYRTEIGSFSVKLMRTDPDDTRLRLLIMRTPNLRKALYEEIGRKVSEAAGYKGQPVVMDSAEGF